MLLTKPYILKRLIPNLEYVGLAVFIFGMIFGLFYTFFISPKELLHQDLVKILYIHVPFAWMSLTVYVWMGIFSFLSIILKSNVYELFANALVKCGTVLTMLCIITGIIWAKPAWGVWWVWDARLTSVAILLFLYIIYYVLIMKNNQKMANFICLLGMCNIPIIKYCVNWYFTLHQKASISLVQKPAISFEFMPALFFFLIMVLGWTMIIFSKEFSKFYKKNILCS